MKIVLILGKLNVGGSTHQVLHLASRLSHQGHTCVVLHGRANPDEQIMEREARELGVTTIEVPTIHNELSFAPHIEVRAILTVFRILRELDPDVVHTHSAKAGLIGRVSASLARVPVVVHTFHGHLLKDYFGKCRSLMLRLMEMALGYLTTKVIAVSASDSRELADLGVAKRSNIIVIPCGIDLRNFKEGGSGRVWLRTNLELPLDTLLFGAVGRHVFIKGYSDLIEAFALLRNKHLNVALVLFGEGPLSVELKRATKRLGLDNQVFFMGSTNNVSDIYGQLDFLVLPSLREGLSITLLEAMASGVPVIATEVGGTPEIVIHQETGLLCRPGDPEDFVEKMIWAAENRKQMSEMAELARHRLFNCYDVARMVGATSSLYEQLLR